MNLLKININSDIKEITYDLEKYFQESKEIYISVAYISHYFLDLYEKYLINKEVYVITTTNDQNIDVDVLKRLYEISNSNLYIYEERLMHSKLLIFIGNDNKIRFTIGSLNLTENALEAHNVELNVILNDTTGESFKFFNKIKKNADVKFRNDEEFDNFIRKYSKRKAKFDKIFKVLPRGMQLETLDKFRKMMNNTNKSILVAATGTGKTYMSAFAAEEWNKVNGGKVLFLVHNRTILRAAIESYSFIFRDKRIIELKLDSDLDKINDSDLLFTTDKFAKKHIKKLIDFDISFIIFDEVHRLGYIKEKNEEGKDNYHMTNHYYVFDEFSKLQSQGRKIYMLGMTATPYRIHNNETIDSIQDAEEFLIEKVFEGNVLNYIPIEKAINKEYITSFKYNGVSIDKNLSTISNNENDLRNALDKSISKLIDVGIYNNKSKIKGLIFVRTIDAAKKVKEIINSSLYNGRQFYSGYIKGGMDEEEIYRMMDNLESEENESLNFIVSVNKFNEGIDIPSINTIIMLRPTKSQIIYTQQIGRGLRRIEGEDKYLTIIDVIGNDKSNWISVSAITKKSSNDKDGNIDGTINKMKEEVEKFKGSKIEEIPYYKILQSLSFQNIDLDHLKNIFRKHNLYEKDKPKLTIDDILSILKWDINKLRNTLIDKNFFQSDEIPWLVKFDHLSKNIKQEIVNDEEEYKTENQFIEKISWMTLTTSSSKEKEELIKLFTIGKANIGIKWFQYFNLPNIPSINPNNDKKPKGKCYGPFFDYSDNRFSWNEVNNQLLLDINSLSKREKEYMNKVIELLRKNIWQDNLFQEQQIYTRMELLFMFGYTSFLIWKDFPQSKIEWRENGLHDRLIIGTVSNDSEEEFVNIDLIGKLIEINFSSIRVKGNKRKQEWFNDVERIHMFIENTKLQTHKKVKAFMYMGATKPRIRYHDDGNIYQRLNIKWNLKESYNYLQGNKLIFEEIIKENNN